jgi:hypothetical protein
MQPPAQTINRRAGFRRQVNPATEVGGLCPGVGCFARWYRCDLVLISLNFAKKVAPAPERSEWRRTNVMVTVWSSGARTA